VRRVLIHYRAEPGTHLESVTDGDGHRLQSVGDDWWEGILPSADYRYRVVDAESRVVADEGLPARRVPPGEATVVDRWRDPDPARRARTSALFTRAIAARHDPPRPASGSTVFRLLEAAIPPGYRPVAVGGHPALGAWDLAGALPLQPDPFPWWSAGVDADLAGTTYKYAVVGPGGEVTWEDGDDRVMPAPGGALEVVDESIRGLTPWRGAGVAVPVFALRSERSVGAGQFPDLIPFVDWAAEAGLSVVQILPVNDTVKTHDWDDSYPYDPVSVHALHLLHLDLAEVADRHPSSSARVSPLVTAAAARLDRLPEVEYEEVMSAKWDLAATCFEATIGADAEAVATFVDAEWDWLGPYAAWCVLRDHHGTPDMTHWGDDATYDPDRVAAMAEPSSAAHRAMAFHCWLQFHLHRQLDAAVAHARDRGVAIKGDLPIGVSPTSVETWVAPHLFRVGSQSGAPPDAFAAKGQNWGFPTYVWEAMAADGYAWWRSRFAAMARSVDAYRIDHVLGFFRIWEIPPGQHDGLLGVFRPCLPLDGDRLAAEMGIPREALTRPVVDDARVEELLGSSAAGVIGACFEGETSDLRFRPAYTTQAAIADAVEDGTIPGGRDVLRPLLDLRADVLAIDVEGGVHPRILWGDTEAWRRLDDDQRRVFDAAATDFFFHRHEASWGAHGRDTLAALLDATDLLACGEDLGMVPAVVPTVMADLGVLSLEIERMPKALGAWIADPSRAPYPSVVSPSTHDMSPIRLWWREDRDLVSRYWAEALGHSGDVPDDADPRTCSEVVERQLASPAMLAIVPIQDLLAIDTDLRRPDPGSERINLPADRHHHWRYRLHLSVEDLTAASSFTARLRAMVGEAGR
jgi:4-alpha-glucanotransferase